jgi:thymidylate kinase
MPSSSEITSRGFWIALFGPDGAGKSAVIECLTAKLAVNSSGTTKFHFRPMFHSRGIDRKPVTAPHARPPRSSLVSLGKLIYWLLDCWFGYWIVIRPATARSQIVIFDRYLPDVLVDPARYRLPLSSMRVARMLVRLAPRPDLCILLDVPAKVAQQRKQEVSFEESLRQRAVYLEMFKDLPNKLIVDAVCPVEEVTRQVAAAVFSFFSSSSSNSREASAIAGL